MPEIMLLLGPKVLWAEVEIDAVVDANADAEQEVLVLPAGVSSTTIPNAASEARSAGDASARA